MPRPRFEHLEAEKKIAIIDAASGEFAEQGYTGASMNRIIGRAGISKGALYYYFDDKEDLFLTVILDIHDKVLDAVGDFPEVTSAEDFWRAAGDFFRATLTFAFEHPVFAGLIRSFNTAVARGELKRPLREFQQPHFDFHRRFIRAGQTVGAVRSDLPDDLLFPIIEGIDQAGDLWFARHFEEFSPGDMESVHGLFLNLYRRILRPGDDVLEMSP
jgi:AcrR family transcriptional regulator